MNYADIHELAIHQGRPAASLYILCTDGRGCINKINAKCLEAAAQARDLYKSEAGEQLAKKLESLHSRIPIEAHVKSVAIFVNEHIAWAYALPYATRDQVLVSDRFVVEDIIRHLGQSLRYWVLVLFHGKPFLFDGYDETILEVVHRHNLKTGEERIDLSDLAGRVCLPSVWRTNCRYKNVLEFIRAVDRDLGHFVEADPLPLICFADKESLETFRQHSHYADRILLSVPIDRLYDQEDLQLILWPLLQKNYAHLQTEMLAKLREACHAHLCARGVVAVWRALHEGRAQFICIAREHAQVVCELPLLDTVMISQDCHDGSPKDGIQLLVELALREGVPLCWYDDKRMLEEFSYVAAIVSSADQETPASS